MPVCRLIAAAAAAAVACACAGTAAAQAQVPPASGTAHAADAADVAGAAPDHERIGRFIYAFFRAGGRDAQDLEEPGRAAAVPADLAARAHRLVVRFDAAVEMAAAMPDGELRAIVDEAGAVHAALAAARAGSR